MKLKPLATALALVLASAGFSSFAQESDVQEDKPCKEQGKQRFKRPRFADLDLNQDSLVTLEEFKQKDIPHGDHDRVFRHIDVDGNGEITRQEFESHRPPGRPPHDRQGSNQQRSGKKTSNY